MLFYAKEHIILPYIIPFSVNNVNFPDINLYGQTVNFAGTFPSFFHMSDAIILARLACVYTNRAGANSVRTDAMVKRTV